MNHPLEQYLPFELPRFDQRRGHLSTRQSGQLPNVDTFLRGVVHV